MRVLNLMVAALMMSNVDASAQKTNPIAKVLEMLNDLSAKVVREGEVEQKEYEQFVEWCEDESRTKMNEIKSGKADAEDSAATIAKAASDIDGLDTKIGEFSEHIATAEADLASAAKIRSKERADFESADKELTETMDTLDRAVRVLEKALNGGSFVQMSATAKQGLAPLMQALSALIEVPTVSAHDKVKLQAFLQSSEDEDSPAGAPSADAYESKSGGILETLQDMTDKAEQQRDDSRKAEMTAGHNFEMLKQSLKSEMKRNTEELEKAKKAQAAAKEVKAKAEGELEVTNKALSQDQAAIEEVHKDCMAKAVAFETSQKERAEELKALHTATEIIKETTGGASTKQYSLMQEATSFVQLTSSTSARKQQVLSLLRALAHGKGSSDISALAARTERMLSEASFTQVAAGADPFKKVKNMISEMVSKLENEAAKEAEEKAFCDKEMSETKEKRSNLEEVVGDLTAKIDSAEAQSEKLATEVAALQKELAELASSQLEMDKLRTAEKEEFKIVESDFAAGLEGVRLALKVLRDYYAADKEEAAFVQLTHEKSTDSSSGIIGMLEVVESDFEKSLADARANESEAQSEYERVTQENKLGKTTKSQDVKYKTQEKAQLAEAIAETKQDRDGSQTELDAVLEYWDKLKPQCVAKPETYEERKKRREGEIAGLKNALEILAGEAVAFLQKRA